MHRRLRKLEHKRGLSQDAFTIFFWSSAAGINTAHIIHEGGSFSRNDYASDDAFKTAVDTAHKAVHGTPVNWKEDQLFDDGTSPASNLETEKGKTI